MEDFHRVLLVETKDHIKPCLTAYSQPETIKQPWVFVFSVQNTEVKEDQKEKQEQYLQYEAVKSCGANWSL